MATVPRFKNFSYKILVIWANFARFLWIWRILVHIDLKIFEKGLSHLYGHVLINFRKFWFSNFVKIAKLW